MHWHRLSIQETPGPHVLQVSIPPQPSSMSPQTSPSCAHVFGVHVTHARFDGPGITAGMFPSGCNDPAVVAIPVFEPVPEGDEAGGLGLRTSPPIRSGAVVTAVPCT